jgi:hypothetical protein
MQTSVVNTKLPVYKNNRICTSEQGCDEIYSGDSVFVDGCHSVQCEHETNRCGISGIRELSIMAV